MSLDSLIQSLDSSLKWAASQHYRSMQTLTLWQEEVKRLPEYASGWVSPDSIHLTYYASNNAEELRSACQAVIGSIALREVDKDNGQVYYKLSADRVLPDGSERSLNITITGGQLAPGCRLRVKEVTETRKVFDVICPEGDAT